MAQVIEVKLINPASQEVIHQAFTIASSHTEAINLAMNAFSGGIGVIKQYDRLDQAETFVHAGIVSAWRSLYGCVVDDDEGDRYMLAILYSQYREKK